MISVVIPALNEEAAIAATIEGVRAACAAGNLEAPQIVVVDDGSADATGAIARDNGAVVVRHPHNIGYGRSLKDGILAATNDVIVIADADGTYPLDQIPVLLAKFQEGFDMVVGARTGAHYRESLIKSPLRAILTFLVEFTCGRRVPDVNSGLRIFCRSTVLPYLLHLCDTFSFTTSLTLAYMMTGRFVAYVPIAYHSRIGHSKVRLFRDALRSLQFIVQAIIYYNPLKLFMLMSALCLGLGITSFTLSIVFQLTSAFLFGIATMVLSILVFCLGLIADLLRQIMANRPDTMYRPYDSGAPENGRGTEPRDDAR